MRIFKLKGAEEVFSVTNIEQEVKTSLLLNAYLLKPEYSDLALQQSFLKLFMVNKSMFSWTFLIILVIYGWQILNMAAKHCRAIVGEIKSINTSSFAGVEF